MKKQSGFTLIELLLVLAIIGIISAIAIPALLSQRARARDKAALENMVSRVADLAGQWDKGREAGLASGAIVTSMQTYLAKTAAKDKNPWNGAQNAFVAATPHFWWHCHHGFWLCHLCRSLGHEQRPSWDFGIQTPGANGFGFLGGAVLMNASSTSDTTANHRTKVVAIE